MNHDALVIGVGNDFRCDDGIGLAVAAELAKLRIAGVRVMTAVGEPGSILDAWTGVPLAIAVDAAMGEGSTPGTIRRWAPGSGAEPTVTSSHKLGLAQTYSLGHALRRLPQRLVGFTVDVQDVGPGVALTPAVSAAVPRVVAAILAELDYDPSKRLLARRDGTFVHTRIPPCGLTSTTAELHSVKGIHDDRCH